MSKWGFTNKTAGLKPWGLQPKWLKADKTITDPIHGDIYLTKLERTLVDSPSFQRLRRVRQLGTTHLVYPGATHTRFQHSLGALRVAQDVFDNLVENSLVESPAEPRPGGNLFLEWREEEDYERLACEALVLARLGALLHDMCHVPYGHTVEDDNGLLTPHDRNAERFDAFWSDFDEDAIGALDQDGLKDELRHLILSKEETDFQSRYPFVSDIVGNTICADLVDYLWRDYYFTGLPGKLGTRFLSYFFVTSSEDPDWPSHMALRISKKNRLRADVISEVLKYLRYRYELGERALRHHAKVAADTMLAKSVSMMIERVGKPKVEAAFRKYGDDGILDYLIDEGDGGVAELARRVRDRRLYKPVAISASGQTYLDRDRLYKSFGGVAGRTEVEDKLAELMELPNNWQALVLVPNPKMSLKAADVLVRAKKSTCKLREWDELNGKRANEIYESHERLWSIQLFVDPELEDAKQMRAKAYVEDNLRIDWDDETPDNPVSHVLELAMEELIREHAGWGDVERELMLESMTASKRLSAGAPSALPISELKSLLEGAVPKRKRKVTPPPDKPQDTLLENE